MRLSNCQAKDRNQRNSKNKKTIIFRFKVATLLLIGLMLVATYASAIGRSRFIVRHKPRRSPIAATPLSQFRQNEEIDRLHIPRIIDDEQLADLERDGELIELRGNFISFDPGVEASRRYARVWTVQFVREMSEAFGNKFGARLRISSAVRTEEQQRLLTRLNRFAAAPTKSSHVAGITVDIPKRQLPPAQRKWLVAYLRYWRDMGIIDPVEEPYCFHVAVYERYNEYAQKEFK